MTEKLVTYEYTLIINGEISTRWLMAYNDSQALRIAELMEKRTGGVLRGEIIPTSPEGSHDHTKITPPDDRFWLRQMEGFV